MTTTPSDPYALAQEAASFLLSHWNIDSCHIAITLGSGWSAAAEVLSSHAQQVSEISMSEVPGFLAPTAQGHAGTIRLLQFTNDDTSRSTSQEESSETTNVLLFLGRTHAYEGHELWRTVHSARTAAATGISTAILTNAAGGLEEGMSVGDAVLISDHINTTGRSPLVGARFVNMVDAYSPHLRAIVSHVRPDIREAVYAMMPGPQYETPAEIQALRTMGAGLVGMSTVYETIALREKEVAVLGISLVTNLAAGITGEALNHEEVLQAGQESAHAIGSLLADLIPQLSA